MKDIIQQLVGLEFTDASPKGAERISARVVQQQRRLAAVLDSDRGRRKHCRSAIEVGAARVEAR